MKRTISILLALLMATSALSGVVVAQSDSEDMSHFDQLRTPGDQGSPGVLPSNAAEEATQAVSKALTTGNRLFEKYVGNAGDENATQYADDFQQSFNSNNQTLIEYANSRMNASADREVIAIEFTDVNGNTDTRYLVSTVDNESYQSAKIVESTDRSVDENISADWYVSRHASDELDSFISTYAEPDEDFSNSYYTTMVAKYGGGLNGSLWGDA